MHQNITLHTYIRERPIRELNSTYMPLIKPIGELRVTLYACKQSEQKSTSFTLHKCKPTIRIILFSILVIEFFVAATLAALNFILIKKCVRREI